MPGHPGDQSAQHAGAAGVLDVGPRGSVGEHHVWRDVPGRPVPALTGGFLAHGLDGVEAEEPQFGPQPDAVLTRRGIVVAPHQPDAVDVAVTLQGERLDATRRRPGQLVYGVEGDHLVGDDAAVVGVDEHPDGAPRGQ